MPKKTKTRKLTLHKETVRQLAETALGDVAGGLGVKPIGAVWSDGRLCTGGPTCTAVLGCSFKCA